MGVERGGSVRSLARDRVTTAARSRNRSVLATYYSGGLHIQTLHHCFPTLSLVHYVAFYPAFVEVCRKHHCLGVRSECGFWDGFARYWGYIFHLGSLGMFETI